MGHFAEHLVGSLEADRLDHEVDPLSAVSWDFHYVLQALVLLLLALSPDFTPNLDLELVEALEGGGCWQITRYRERYDDAGVLAVHKNGELRCLQVHFVDGVLHNQCICSCIHDFHDMLVELDDLHLEAYYGFDALAVHDADDSLAVDAIRDDTIHEVGYSPVVDAIREDTVHEVGTRRGARCYPPPRSRGVGCTLTEQLDSLHAEVAELVENPC